ncbi:MAG: 2-dehydro-3-deoxygalactonokinase [Kiloniellales bacterium]|nr:2-dehydro-3-deoxygalactonokinase [Kiloniellales bacterium]
MNEGAPVLAAVDWGTSRFRLWLLDSQGRALVQRQGPEGLEAGRRLGFEAVLRDHLRQVSAPETLPILICGMAGSHEGWVEAPYVDLPASLNQLAEAVVAVPAIGLDVRIVPGLAKRDPAAPDVMRGEETQLIGVAAIRAADRMRVCLPGTHSKWVVLEDRRVEDFTSYLTGELYAVLSRHSILRHSLAGADAEAPFDPENPVFIAALKRALAAPERFLAELFSIRAAGLLDGLAGSDAVARLSGFLIGAEVAAALSGEVAPVAVTLVASSGMARYYGTALTVAGAAVETVDAERAVCAGLMAIASEGGAGGLSGRPA